jgi:hypothetical protein
MELLGFLVILGGCVGTAQAGGNWRQVVFWPFYAAKKVGVWAMNGDRE